MQLKIDQRRIEKVVFQLSTNDLKYAARARYIDLIDLVIRSILELHILYL